MARVLPRLPRSGGTPPWGPGNPVVDWEVASRPNSCNRLGAGDRPVVRSVFGPNDVLVAFTSAVPNARLRNRLPPLLASVRLAAGDAPARIRACSPRACVVGRASRFLAPLANQSVPECRKGGSTKNQTSRPTTVHRSSVQKKAIDRCCSVRPLSNAAKNLCQLSTLILPPFF